MIAEQSSHTRFSFEVEGTDYANLEAAATLHVLRLIGGSSLDATWNLTITPGIDLSTHDNAPTWQWHATVDGVLSEHERPS